MTDKNSKPSGSGESVGYRNPPKSGQFAKGRLGNLRGRPPRPKTANAGAFGDSEFDAMIVEEMDRMVTVREGETIERTSLMRAATRAIGLKAAKGDVKAYHAMTTKRAGIENRRRVEREKTRRHAMNYKETATLELMRRKSEGTSGPEVIPHPDDIDIDPKTGAVILNGPFTFDQKMAQDIVMSNWPRVERYWRDSLPKDPRCLRQFAKMKRGFGIVVRLVTKRASKINSWDLATEEERLDHLRKVYWPTISRNFPPEVVQSEFHFKSTFQTWSGIAPTEEDRQAFRKSLGMRSRIGRRSRQS